MRAFFTRVLMVNAMRERATREREREREREKDGWERLFSVGVVRVSTRLSRGFAV